MTIQTAAVSGRFFQTAGAILTGLNRRAPNPVRRQSHLAGSCEQTFWSKCSRAEVQQQAVAAAHAKDQNIPLHARSMGALQNPRDRASVKAEAFAAAHDGAQNLEAGAFANSQIPANLHTGALTTRSAGL